MLFFLLFSVILVVFFRVFIDIHEQIKYNMSRWEEEERC